MRKGDRGRRRERFQALARSYTGEALNLCQWPHFGGSRAHRRQTVGLITDLGALAIARATLLRSMPRKRSRRW
jgi:hypothetical protein